MKPREETYAAYPGRLPSCSASSSMVIGTSAPGRAARPAEGVSCVGGANVTLGWYVAASLQLRPLMVHKLAVPVASLSSQGQLILLSTSDEHIAIAC